MSTRIHRPCFDPAEQPESIGVDAVVVFAILTAFGMIAFALVMYLK